MGERLTDKRKKKICADYIKCKNYRETGRINNVSDYTVRKIVREINIDVSREIAQKEEQNTKDTISFMQEQHDLKKELLYDILKAMSIKAKNPDMFTNIKDLAFAYGIIFDKEIKLTEIKQAENNKQQNGILPDILEALKNAKSNVE